jgi:hypothetical protein
MDEHRGAVDVQHGLVRAAEPPGGTPGEHDRVELHATIIACGHAPARDARYALG